LHFAFQTLFSLPKLVEGWAIGIRQKPSLFGFYLGIAGLVVALAMIVINLVNGRPALITGAADMLLAAIRKAPSPVRSKILARGTESSTSW
jgi:hypothetical protein